MDKKDTPTTSDSTTIDTVARAPMTPVTSSAPKLGALTGGIALLASMFRTDKTKEEMGAWMPLGDGVRIRVRRDTSAVAIEVRDRLLGPFRPALKTGVKLTKSQSEAFSSYWAAEGLTAEWEGITDGETIVPCTPDNVVMLYTELPELRDAVVEFAVNMQNYRPDAPAVVPTATPAAG